MILLVEVGFKGGFLTPFGGDSIAPNAVLTAAHCFSEPFSPSQVF